MQTAVTILFALLLTIAFSARFENVDDFQRVVYVATLTFSAVATGLTIAPVAYHRTFFRRGHKKELVAVAHRFIWMALLVLLAAVVGSLVLVVDEVIGRALALAMGVSIGVVLIALWFVMPASARQARRPSGTSQYVPAARHTTSLSSRSQLPTQDRDQSHGALSPEEP